ncbi:MAG: pyruvate, phosphate dikinase [Acidobacteria bacterium]|nr:pyruvate, phosphate dikinase [Acidobacteriota bacterium]
MPGEQWREQFEDLKRRRPELAERVCRKLLTDLHREGLINIDALDEDVAAALRLGVTRRQDDPNRPMSQLPAGSNRTFYDLALKYAAKFLAPGEISAAILLVEKRQLAYEVSRLAEDSDTPLDALRRKMHELLTFYPDEAIIPKEDLIGTRASLVRRLLTDQLDFISVAKRFIRVSDFGWVLDHVVPTDGNQGRLGGKSAGLILARSILDRAKREGRFTGQFTVPVSYFLPSNGILEFIEYNGLEELINVKYRPLDEVRKEYPLVQRLFKSAQFPPTMHEGLKAMLADLGEVPLVIRSSSLLEDRIGHVFSGKYKSLFIPNAGELAARLETLEDAVAEVYASIFAPDPIEYRRERGLLDFQEQMGILIQVVVGQRTEDMVCPVFAGVAFSRCEMRWASRIRPSDGMARLVVGLGTRAVDRTGDDYPALVALEQPTLKAAQQPDEVYRYSQHTVDIIDLKKGEFDAIPLVELLGRVGRRFPMLRQIFSIYRDGQLLPLISAMDRFDPSELVVTFDGLLRSGFPHELKAMLDVLEEGLGEPVDIELAHDGEMLHVLQCRALSQSSTRVRVPIPDTIRPEDIVFTANRFVQTAQVTNQEWIVLVDPRDYERLATEESMRRVAETVGALNETLPARRFILMGPGRWGSRGDIRLGVPVTYSDICHASLLIEIARKRGNYLPDVSFGTHFFQDLVESEIAYLPLYPDDPGVAWNEEILGSSPGALARLIPEFADMEQVVRAIHVPEVAHGCLLHVIMDGDEDRAVAYLE